MNVRGSYRSACASAAVWLALAGGRAWGEQLVGVVNSVDTQAAKLVVVEKATDRTVDVTVMPQTTIVTGSGRSVTLRTLKKGDGVGIAHTGGVAAKIVVNQAPLLGVVDAVDLDAKTFVVDQQGTDREIKVHILPATTLESAGGKLYHLKNLKSGDGVRVDYDGEDVAKVVVNPKPTELTAHVKSVAADLKSLVVTEAGTDAEVRVIVTPDTSIVTAEGKTMDLKQLKKGDGVGIAHEASVASKIVVNPAPAR
jgi:hypothetical protein